MHLAVDGAVLGKKKMVVLLYSFIYAMTTRVLSQFAIGVLWVSKTMI
jgi:hypothetical protein